MKKVLVVVDMQNDFIDGSLGTSEAQAIVQNVADFIRSFDGFVIPTQDTHFDDYLETQEGVNLPVKHCIRGTDGWDINKDVLDALNSKGLQSYQPIQKLTFGSTALVNIIGFFDFDDIVLVGLCTDICVVSNALMLKAAYPEKKITVMKDLCAGVAPKSHEDAINTMKMCQINIE